MWQWELSQRAAVGYFSTAPPLLDGHCCLPRRRLFTVGTVSLELLNWCSALVGSSPAPGSQPLLQQSHLSSPQILADIKMLDWFIQDSKPCVPADRKRGWGWGTPPVPTDSSHSPQNWCPGPGSAVLLTLQRASSVRSGFQPLGLPSLFPFSSLSAWLISGFSFLVHLVTLRRMLNK